jgi:hypothetical protein
MISKRLTTVFTSILICIASLCQGAFAMDDRFLKDVQVQPSIVDYTEPEEIQISFQLSVAGKVQVLICDLDGNIVRPLVDGKDWQAGTHTVGWDGKDLNGEHCPVGAYLPIIKIRSERGRVNVHNPTSTDWGEEMLLNPPIYDDDNDTVRFSLPKSALCLLRIGKVKSACYGTLLNWVPRPAGDVEVPWNGKDAQNTINLGERENLAFRLITIALPETSILVLSSPQKPYPKDTQFKRFPLHPAHGKNVFIHAHHRRWICKDYTINARIENADRKWWGQRVARGEAIIRVDLDSRDNYKFLEREHFEIYLYVDDQFLGEEKKESVPATIKLDTTQLTNGIHIINVGLRTLEDHMGTYTMKIKIDN